MIFTGFVELFVFRVVFWRLGACVGNNTCVGNSLASHLPAFARFQCLNCVSTRHFSTNIAQTRSQLNVKESEELRLSNETRFTPEEHRTTLARQTKG